MERLLEDAAQISGIKYDISNLDDVYSAIHVIQTELGITGTTAQEATETFSGSLNAMKAAATNLLTAWTSGGDLTTALNNLGTTTFTFLQNNFIPMLGRFMEQIPTILSGLGNMLIQALNITANNADAIVTFGANFIAELITGITASIPNIIVAMVSLAMSLGEALITFDWVGTAQKVIEEIGNNLDSFAGEILGSDQSIIESIILGIGNALVKLITAAGDIISSVVSGITTHLPEIILAGINLVVQLISGIIQAIPQLLSSISSLCANVKSAFSNVDWWSVGEAIIRGILDGLWSLAGSLYNAAMDLARNILNNVKGALGIHSPSKKFAEIGEYMMLGLAGGIETNSSLVTDAMDDVANMTMSELSGDYGIGASAITRATGAMTADIGVQTGSGLIDGIREGVADANSTQYALLVKQNELLQKILDKSGVYLDGQMLKSSLNKYSRAMGVS